MSFFMDGLDAEAYDRRYDDRYLVRRILGYFRPAARLMLIAAAMVTLGSVMDTVLPVLLARGIDTLAVTRGLQTVGLLVGAILAAGSASWCCNYIRQVCTSRAVGDVVLRLRLDAFDAVLARDMSFYDEFPSAKIVSRVTTDTEGFTNVVTLVLGLLSQLLLVVLIAGVMFYLNVKLTLLALVIAPVVTTIALAFRTIARRT
ncbi:MAG TPA: ABC transporter ATP-binding protein, partial [Chloroflexota bacterium]|nr:ABC transporter ATP-binding protein [Chloroflexota bacterium]